MVGSLYRLARAAALLAVAALVLPSQAFPCCCALQRATDESRITQPAPELARPSCCQGRSASSEQQSAPDPHTKPGCDGCNAACCCGKAPCETEVLPDLAFLRLVEREAATFAGADFHIAPALDGLLRPPRT